MNATLQIPLDIPNIRLLSSRNGERGELILEVESHLSSTKCHHCGKEITEFHGYDRPIQLRHFINLLATWQDGITNYFNDRQTSGFVEGLNNKLKVIKRRCYGLFDPKCLFQQI